MQTYEKDGYVFVGDLFWPTPSNKSINIQKLKTEIGVDLFVKVVGSTTNYGFTKKSTFSKKLKKIVSLGAFLLNFYEDDATDIIIVVRLAENVAGLLALKNGYVIPRGGDMIGTVEETRGRVIHLIENHGIGSIWTAGFDQYFYNDKEIISRIKNINPHFIAPIDGKDDNGNPLQSIWNYENTKKAIKKSILRSIPIIDLQDKKMVSIIFSFLFMILGLILYINSQKKAEVRNFIPPSHVVIPTSLTAINFTRECFNKTNNYFDTLNGWQLAEFTCTINQRVSKFVSEASQPNALIEVLNNQDIIFNEGGATLKETLKPDFLRIHNNVSIKDKIAKMQSLKQIAGITIQIMMPSNFISYSTNNVQSIKFTINSKFSPLWFIKNNYFEGVNLSNVDASYDSGAGFYTWIINGEIIN